jgi:hypothetical protein
MEWLDRSWRNTPFSTTGLARLPLGQQQDLPAVFHHLKTGQWLGSCRHVLARATAATTLRPGRKLRQFDIHLFHL